MDFLKKGVVGKNLPARPERTTGIPTRKEGEAVAAMSPNSLPERELDHAVADGPDYALYSGQPRGGKTDSDRWGGES